MNTDQFVNIALLCVGFVVLLGIGRRQEAIRFALRRLVIVGLSYIGVYLILAENRLKPFEAVLGALVVALVVDRFISRRSRYIPKSERRKVIARFESGTGQRYNPRIHDIDHKVPFAKGGSNTADNLQVLERRRNRAKRDKAPWWDLLGR